MPYPINQRAHQFNSIQSVPVSFGLWDTALKFLSPGPCSDVTDHLVRTSALEARVARASLHDSGFPLSMMIFIGLSQLALEILRNRMKNACLLVKT